MTELQKPRADAALFQYFRGEAARKAEREKRLQEQRDIDGALGEKYSKAWLLAREIEHLEVDQTDREFNQELMELGGKRPDFVAHWTYEGKVVDLLFDAKHRTISSDEMFWMSHEELNKYLVTEKWIAEFDSEAYMVLVVFIVTRKNGDGDDIYIVGLNELLAKGSTTTLYGKPGKRISLEGLKADW